MKRFVKVIVSLVLMLGVVRSGAADVVYVQPPNASGALFQSSWWDPEGSDWDQYVWDNFTLASSSAVTEIRWRGGYIYGGSFGGPVPRFRVSIHATSVVPSQPDVV